MGRKNSLAKNSIQMLCVMQHLDEQNLYERSKLLLSIYRNVCWTACDRAAMLREEAEYCYGRELEEGLLYLNDFAPTVEREKFEETVKSLFQTKWLVELVDSAMVKMRDFPYSPQLYFDIVFKCYLAGSDIQNLNYWKRFGWKEAHIMIEKRKQLKYSVYPFGGVLFLKSNRLWKNRYFMNRGEVVL